MRASQTRAPRQGFTLVEVMIVLAIIGTLAAIAAPALIITLSDIRLSSAARDLYGVIMTAKKEAAKRNSNCTLVFNQVIGPPIFAVNTTVAYVLFVDNDLDSEYDLPVPPLIPGEPIITYLAQWPDSVALNLQQGGGTGFTIPVNDNNLPFISFRPNSIPINNNNVGLIPSPIPNLGGLANTIFLASTDFANPDDRTKCVTLNQSGNVRIAIYDNPTNSCN